MMEENLNESKTNVPVDKDERIRQLESACYGMWSDLQYVQQVSVYQENEIQRLRTALGTVFLSLNGFSDGDLNSVTDYITAILSAPKDENEHSCGGCAGCTSQGNQA